MAAPQPSPAPGQPDCYCGLWQTSHETLLKDGLPPGFCGKCEVCGRPGHTRAYPGPVPYTGAWCDACYAAVGRRSAVRFVRLIPLLLVLAPLLLVLRGCWTSP